MRDLTQKQIKLLIQLNGDMPVIARWDHEDLRDFARAGFVHSEAAKSANGKLSASLIYRISERGKRFLIEEREGL
jgi:hypothetical protein